MDIWDIESRISGLTTGSCETLDDLDLITWNHESHDAYRGSCDVLGLEVPSMELWDESYGPNDGFGFFGGMEPPGKKDVEKDDSSSSGIHCDEPKKNRRTSISKVHQRVTQVKCVDDYNPTHRPPHQGLRHHRYRKRSKQGRYSTADISYNPSNGDELHDKKTDCNDDEEEESCFFQRQTFKTRSLNIIVREDNADHGSVTNLFVDRSEGSKIGRASLKQTQNHYLGQDSLFPYSFNKCKSHSCDELSPPKTNHQVRHARSRSEIDSMNEVHEGNKNTNNRARLNRRNKAMFTASSWLKKDATEKTQSRESFNSLLPGPNNGKKDLKTLTNVKVIATQSYTAQVSHELSFKKGQKLKLKSHSMDGDFGYGWKKLSLIGGKKYGYFPLSHVMLYEKLEK